MDISSKGFVADMMDYEIEIRKSKRKTIAIEIKDAGHVVVRAPLRASNRSIQEFISQNNDWIEKHLAKAEKRQEVRRNIRTLSDLELEELIASAKRVIPERVRYFAPIVGVDYGRITIRNQRTRWGSCSSKGNLNFNIALMRAPIEVLDYVVVHELCHRKEMNHSPRFWSEVGKVLPDYKVQERWLKEHGDKLMAEVHGE